MEGGGKEFHLLLDGWKLSQQLLFPAQALGSLLELPPPKVSIKPSGLSERGWPPQALKRHLHEGERGAMDVGQGGHGRPHVRQLCRVLVHLQHKRYHHQQQVGPKVQGPKVS